MRLNFWGTRGSIAVPGPGTVVYGGNTPCLEIQADESPTIILDAGTGIRGLGLGLARSMPVSCAVFITHTHWDHIQGLPFFAPLFTAGNAVAIHGTFDPVGMKGIQEILAGQMDYAYFPVTSAQLRAEVSYLTLREGQAVEVGQARVTPVFMNHTVIAFGYKVECGGRAVFYTGDHEGWANIYDPGDEFYEEYEVMLGRKRDQLADFVRGADVVVADGQYAREEYPAKAGWGHSTPEMCLRLAQAAGVKRLYLTHHEPTRDDQALEAMLEDVRERHAGCGVDIRLAAEGQGLEV